MTSRTNYYKTVTQIFKFEDHLHESQTQPKLEQSPPPVSLPPPPIEEKYEERKSGKDPSVFGPPLWFTLHNSSVYYPENPSPVHAERMKNIIIGLPVLLPCETCKEHATAYIENNKHQLPDICKSRQTLFRFFVDFHNYVNERLKKKIFTYEEAEKLYYY